MTIIVPAVCEPLLKNQPPGGRLAVIIDLLQGPGGGMPSIAQAAGAGPTVLGPTGAIGDFISGILVIPSTTSPGAIKIRDSVGGADITVFVGGATSVADLKPFFIPLGFTSVAGGWALTTGANMSVFAYGRFTP